MSNQYQEKIWGRVCHLFDSEVGVSLLDVNSGFRCSTHYHKHRWNSFKSISAVVDILFLYKEHAQDGILWKPYSLIELNPGQSLDVPPEIIHLFQVRKSGKLVEVYWTTDGTPVDMEDIVRFDEGCRI